jgi:hypothetical protein
MKISSLYLSTRIVNSLLHCTAGSPPSEQGTAPAAKKCATSAHDGGAKGATTNSIAVSPNFSQQSKSSPQKITSSALLRSLMKNRIGGDTDGIKTCQNNNGLTQSLLLSPTTISAVTGKQHVASSITIPADVTNYPFKILTAGTLKENESTFKKFIGAQLEAEFSQSASSLSITFEMVLHYINENQSLRSFISLVEAQAVAHKDLVLETVKKNDFYKCLTSTEQKKMTSDWYTLTHKYVFKIGIQLYEFLKEYYIASKKDSYDYFFCKYPFMEPQMSHLLSSDSLKCVIEKVYKEDFILIEAQKRTGLLTIAQSGLLGKVLHNSDVMSSFKSGNFEDTLTMIQSQITADGQHSFVLCDKKKRHIHRILSELTCSNNPFPSESLSDNASSKEFVSPKEIAPAEKQVCKVSIVTAVDSPEKSFTSASSSASIVTNNEHAFNADSLPMEKRIEVFTGSIGKFILTFNEEKSTEEQMNMFLLRTMSSLHQFYSLEALQNALNSVQSNQFSHSINTSEFLSFDSKEPESSPSPPPSSEQRKAAIDQMDVDISGVTTVAVADLSRISNSDEPVSSPFPPPSSEQRTAATGQMDVDISGVTTVVEADLSRISNSYEPVFSPSPFPPPSSEQRTAATGQMDVDISGVTTVAVADLSRIYNSDEPVFSPSPFPPPSSEQRTAATDQMDVDISVVTNVAEADLSRIYNSDEPVFSPSPFPPPSSEQRTAATGQMDVDISGVTTVAEADLSRISNSDEPVSPPSPSYDLERDGIEYSSDDCPGSDRFFTLSLLNLVGRDGVRVISISSSDNRNLEGKKESCFLLSAVLTMILHSIRLIRFTDYVDRQPDCNNHLPLRRKLFSNFEKWGTNDSWPYEEVLEQLHLNPLEFPHQTFSDSNFHFGKCVDSFITPAVLRKKGLRCIGSIELSLCVDYKSLQSSLQGLYRQSLKQSTGLDNSLAIVNVLNFPHADGLKRLKSLPYTVILKSDDQRDVCFQLTAALYISEAKTLKVVQITRSVDTSLLGSNFFHFEFDVGREYNNSLSAVPLSNCIPCEGTSRSKESNILTLLPGNFRLSGLVFLKSTLQLIQGTKNPYLLSPELYRSNEYGGVYGREEHGILSSATKWLSNSIMNSIFGLVSKTMNEVAGEEGTRHILLSSLFFHELLRNPTDFCRLDLYAPDFDMNDTSVNAILHMPVNYPERIHWVYVFLHIKTKCIYLMDSGSNAQGKVKVIQKAFQDFFEADFNRRKVSTLSSSWTCKVIKSPQQPDSWNCGIFTVMNMVRTCETVKRNGYFTSLESSAEVSAPVLKKFRRILLQILFENKTVNDLLTYVNKFPNF